MQIRLPYVLAALVVAAVIFSEWLMGRSFLGPDHVFALWEGNIWSEGCSQRVADAYSFSHIIHGMAFYGLLWLTARRLSVPWRFFIAVVIESAWEILENSPIIINRYRDATMALGYTGDSFLNSVSDILMMAIGFYLALRLPVWLTVVLVVVMEIGCLLWIRDNLTLNILMLTWPIDAIKEWQMGAQP